MNGTNERSAGIFVASRRAKAQGANAIYLDRDALSPRGWLSRRGRRLLDRSGYLLSCAEAWLDRNGAWPGSSLDTRMSWSG